jgi:hypothetical protein
MLSYCARNRLNTGITNGAPGEEKGGVKKGRFSPAPEPLPEKATAFSKAVWLRQRHASAAATMLFLRYPASASLGIHQGLEALVNPVRGYEPAGKIANRRRPRHSVPQAPITIGFAGSVPPDCH